MDLKGGWSDSVSPSQAEGTDMGTSSELKYLLTAEAVKENKKVF